MSAWKDWLNSLPPQPRAAEVPALPLDALREDVAASIVDCGGPPGDRLRYRIARATCADDLWLMRGDLFNLIAARHCQSVAAARINALLPAFQRWLPGRKLAAV